MKTLKDISAELKISKTSLNSLINKIPHFKEQYMRRKNNKAHGMWLVNDKAIPLLTKAKSTVPKHQHVRQPKAPLLTQTEYQLGLKLLLKQNKQLLNQNNQLAKEVSGQRRDTYNLTKDVYNLAQTVKSASKETEASSKKIANKQWNRNAIITTTIICAVIIITCVVISVF